MRVALVHDWLVAHRGGEAVLLELARMFPNAPIYTLVADRTKIHAEIAARSVTTSYIQDFPGAPQHFRRYLPFFPNAIEQFDLSSYELIISTSHCVSKGVLSGDTPHLSYIHTPMRYIWDQRAQYLPQGWRGALGRPAFELAAAALRQWDKSSAQRPSRLVANSNFVANRISKAWDRQASTVYPPVRTDFFTPENTERSDYFAVVGAQVGYKNTALAVEAATQKAFKLKVVGTGPAIEALRIKAGPTVSFAGQVSDEQLRHVYREARALLFCGIEDFGIVPVEAISCGCPVIAFAEGGALETVRITAEPMGVLFAERSVSSVVQAIEQLDSLWSDGAFEPRSMHSYAQGFSADAFKQAIRSEINETIG